jgi:hypothetical protein
MAHNVQNNSHDLDGKVIHISQPKQISEKLTTRTLVLEVFDGNWSRPCPFIFKNGRMDALKDIQEGMWVNVQYKSMGFKGKGEGEPKYYAENEGLTVIKG